MSRQSMSSGAAPLKVENLSSLSLDRKRFSAPPIFTPKTRSSFSGLITPPDSPTRSMPVISPFSPSSLSADQVPLEELRLSRPNTPSMKIDESDCTPSVPVSPSSSTSFSVASEEIYTIIEQAAEQKIAEAIAPLRLNIGRLEESLRLQKLQSDITLDGIKSLESHLHRENADLKDQNDTLSRQLDLHYRTIEQHTHMFNTMLETESTNIQATSQNLAVATGVVSHLSQVIINLPMAINQVVHHAVYQQTQMALDDMLESQHTFIMAMRNLQGMPPMSDTTGDEDTTLRVSSDSSSISSIPSIERMSSSTSQTSGSSRSRGMVRNMFRKLFKSNRKSRMSVL